MTEVTQERVLLVEDDDSLRQLLVEELEDRGLQVRALASAEEAVGSLESWEPALVVSDLRLPGADGMALLRRVKTMQAAPAFLVITAFGSIQQAVAALKEGADEFLTKPLDLEHFALAVARALETRRLRDEVRRFQQLLSDDRFHGMLGRSRVMRGLFDQIRQLARAEGPVLVIGESGTGKELVARAVHAESERARGPFLAINCAGLPAELLESEFFGHVSGAFTGANRAHKGLFQQADGGTLFLDEIGEMPLPLQAKLLRVLQEGTIRPVGAERELSVDVRIIAASNRPLETEAGREAFREDLFFRLETFILQVPPLRDREEDLELLAADQTQQLAGQKPCSEQGDERIGGDFERVGRVGHRHRGAAQHVPADSDQRERRHSLQQRRDEGQQDSPAQLHLIGEHVGRDHRLAVAGAGGVEHPVGKGQADQERQRRAILFQLDQGLTQRGEEFTLIGRDLGKDRTEEAAGRLRGHLGAADSERGLGQGRSGDQRGRENYCRAEANQLAGAHVTSSRAARTLE